MAETVESGPASAPGQNEPIAAAARVPTAKNSAPRIDPRGAGVKEIVPERRESIGPFSAKPQIPVNPAHYDTGQAALAGQGAASVGPKPTAARGQGTPVSTSESGFETAGGPNPTATGAATGAPPGTAQGSGQGSSPTDPLPSSPIPSNGGPSGGGLIGALSLEPAPQSGRAAGAPPTPLDQVAVHIRQAASTGTDRIRIRLHPAELGRVEIKLDVSPDGLVKAIVTLDKAETFELFQRDARGLEKALQEAGLKTDSNSLNFNLRDGGREGFSGRREAPDPGTRAETLSEHPTELPPLDSGRALDLSI